MEFGDLFSFDKKIAPTIIKPIYWLFLVLIVELLNSGIEATVDRISYEMHDLSGRAKDLASAAVMLSLLLCATLWLSALVRKLLS